MANENETTIILNREDMAEGFFTIGTSELKTFEKLCKRIGGENNLLACRKTDG